MEPSQHLILILLLYRRIASPLEFLRRQSDFSDAVEKSRSREEWRLVVMRTITQKRPIDFYGLLSKKALRVAVLLCSLVLVSTAINTLIIVLGSKGL